MKRYGDLNELESVNVNVTRKEIETSIESLQRECDYDLQTDIQSWREMHSDSGCDFYSDCGFYHCLDHSCLP